MLPLNNKQNKIIILEYHQTSKNSHKTYVVVFAPGIQTFLTMYGRIGTNLKANKVTNVTARKKLSEKCNKGYVRTRDSFVDDSTLANMIMELSNNVVVIDAANALLKNTTKVLPEAETRTELTDTEKQEILSI